MQTKPQIRQVLLPVVTFVPKNEHTYFAQHNKRATQGTSLGRSRELCATLALAYVQPRYLAYAHKDAAGEPGYTIRHMPVTCHFGANLHFASCLARFHKVEQLLHTQAIPHKGGAVGFLVVLCSCIRFPTVLIAFGLGLQIGLWGHGCGRRRMSRIHLWVFATNATRSASGARRTLRE